MTVRPRLTALEHDLLTEMLNVGVGRAADSLSKIVNHEVLLSVPMVEFKTRSELAAELGNESTICSIMQNLSGPFSGDSLLLFPDNSGLKVVRSMLGMELSDETLAELQQEALTEIGNIVLNACIGAIANVIDECFDVRVPIFQKSTPEELLQITDEGRDDVLLLTRICIALNESGIEGYIVFVMGSVSLAELQKILSKILGNLTTAA